MKLPFHAVEVRGDILFAARGASIHSFNLTDGSHISCSWKFPAAEASKKVALRKEDQLVINVSENSTPAPSQDEQGPPAKRVKLDGGEAVAAAAAAEASEKTTEVKPTPTEDIQAMEETPNLRGGGGGGGGGGKKNKKQGPRPGPLSQATERPMVILMTVTQDGHYVVAVTSEKSIWVLEHDGKGQLKQLSRRTMPKRPCSVIITPDNQDILAADKFGDVYSIPLIQSPDWKPSNAAPPSDTSAAAAGVAAATGTSPAEAAASPSPSAPSPAAPAVGDKHYKPQATELTVHTGRNRKALLDQQISASHAKTQGGTPRRVEAAPFERYLLLGHVSLLTAVAFGVDAQQRPYILTADRDEHIRVSRGTKAQAHVIEQFCLGHEDFVNRLCIPAANDLGHLLVSAGGDPELFVWRWKEGRLLGKAPLLDAVKAVVPEATKVAVTGLCEWPFAVDENEAGTRMVVICERVPAIFVYHLQPSGVLESPLTLPLEGKPLDMAVINSKKLVVSIDVSFEQDSPIFVSSSLTMIGHTVANSIGNGKIKAAAAADLDDGEADATEAEIQKLLYHAETLRKMENEDGGEAD